MKTEPATIEECQKLQCADCAYWSFEYRDRPFWKCPVRTKMKAEANK